ncbi:MAG: hypothetical protein ACT4O1_01850 [Gemmatimonadota bacterium]
MTVPLWDDYGEGSAPMAVGEALWSPAMILSHDCEIDKEFNREVEKLLRDGLTEEQAQEAASENETLDPYILASPILPYSAIETSQHAGIRQGDRIGYFPVPASQFFDDEPVFVDLSRISTLDRRLILRYDKIASLSEPANGVLRFKLAEALATRGLSTLAEIEAVIGQQIVGAEAIHKNKKATALVLRLASGDELHLEIKRPREAITRELLRYIPFRKRDE